MIWYEWLHVRRGEKQVPHRVCVEAYNVVHHTRDVPHDPLEKSAPLNLYFTLEYMDARAEEICPGSEYVGLVFESDRPAFQRQVPDGGLDIQDHAVYWNFPCGTICCSLNDLSDGDALKYLGDKPYLSIGNQMGWDCLGICTDEASLAQYLDAPGTLEEARWKALLWEEPEKETVPCWWLVNPQEPDKKKPPSLLNRSLALVRIELSQNKVASTSKLRREFEKRTENNSTAVNILHNNQHLWLSVDGPPPDELFRPSAANIEKSKQCSDTLQRMCAVDDRDGLSEFAQEISRAVATLSSVEWEDIRKEKFSLTPPALYSDLVRTAESLISRMAAETTRRQKWLAAEVAPDQDRQVPISASTTDKYGIDLEEFKMKTGKKPKRWKTAVKVAEWIRSWWWLAVQDTRDARRYLYYSSLFPSTCFPACCRSHPRCMRILSHQPLRNTGSISMKCVLC